MDLIGLLPSFGNLAFTLIAFVIALSVIIAVHEYGHYIVGRWSGIHAEVFSLGFGPILWSRTDRRGTKWQVAALPFGGYVKFLGDADAASAGRDQGFLEHVAATEREKEIRRSMHGAPLWARAATVAAGPIFNFVLSILVFATIFMIQGTAVEPPTVGRTVPLPADPGLRAGDVIVAIEGVGTPDYQALYDVIDALEPAPAVTYTVRRDGAPAEIEGAWPMPALAYAIQPGSAAIDAGMRVGDVITQIDGAPIWSFRQVQDAVVASDGAELALTVWRDGATREVRLAPRRSDLPLPEGGFETRWLIGLSGAPAFEPATEAQGPFGAIWDGVRQVGLLISGSLSGLWHMITGAISSCNLRGPIGIAETSGDMASQGAQSFIWFIAVLSTAVGLMNLFPIPVLDGGHLVFHAWEAVARRPPPEKALRLMMGTGLTLILTVMLFALFNDIRCH